MKSFRLKSAENTKPGLVRKHPIMTLFAVIIGFPLLLSLFDVGENATPQSQPAQTATVQEEQTTDSSNTPNETVIVEEVVDITEQEVAKEEAVPTSSLIELQAYSVEETSPASPQTNHELEPITVSSELWYTSSHYSAKYYYHESCDGWQELSSRYLQSYDSEAALKSAHPVHTPHPDCNP